MSALVPLVALHNERTFCHYCLQDSRHKGTLSRAIHIHKLCNKNAMLKRGDTTKNLYKKRRRVRQFKPKQIIRHSGSSFTYHHFALQRASAISAT